MKKIFGRISNGVKKVMNIPKDICKEIVNNDKARLILGMVCIGAGIGLGVPLIASVYIKVPQ